MVEFFRDKLDGGLYIFVALFALFLVMAIIGFIMERLKLEKDMKSKVAHVSRNSVTPVEPVNVETNEQEVNNNFFDTQTENTVKNHVEEETKPASEQEEFIIENYFKEPSEQQEELPVEEEQPKSNVIVFEDNDVNNG